jgi:hypothetical protein
MMRFGIKLLTPAILSMALVAAHPVGPALAAGGGGDPSSASPPPPDTKPPPAGRTSQKCKMKPQKQSGVSDPAFADGYRAAYATIYQANDYVSGIEQLKARSAATMSPASPI